MKISSLITVAIVITFSATADHVSASEPLKKGLRGEQKPNSVARRAKKTCAYDPVRNPVPGPCPPNSAAVFNSRSCAWECKSLPATNPPAVQLPETGGGSNGIQERSSNEEDNTKEYGSGTRSVAVSVTYNEDAQNVAWSLTDTRTGYPVLWSDYGEVSEAGVVTKIAPGVVTGPYQLAVHNIFGSGTGGVEVIDMTEYEVDQATQEILHGGNMLFQHGGRFGAMLLEDIDIF
ncbi:expressed unknown protein [Seminavis robusta]|uniref:Uncharacterized protein n=1 Tax=Seminavis robusta TaxID=568900 RepID=A0A9N8EB76_9STRA|nr:expressed unknown protein [Seminavis robusta]|eukprot:Sro914_g219540.1 n/a (233) ;mRNA; f:8696-9394